MNAGTYTNRKVQVWMESHITELRVRYDEVDQMGVVHHSKYFVYLEIARTEALRGLGLDYRDLERSGALLVIARANCSFHAPARYDDIIEIHTTVARVSAARIDHAYEIKRPADKALLVRAETTLACVDREGKIQAIPEALLDLLPKI